MLWMLSVTGDDFVDISLDAFLVTVQNTPMQAFLRRHPFGRVGLSTAFSRLRRDILEMLDKKLQGIRAAVEDQVFGQLAFFLRNFGIRRDMRRVDNRHIQPGLHGMVKHDAVQHRASRRRQPKRHVAHAQGSQDAWQFTLDQADALDRLDSRIGELRIAGSQGKSQGIVDQVGRAQTVLFYGNLVDAAGNLQFVLGGLRHALLIDGQHQHGGVVRLRQGEDPLGARRPAFQMGRVEHAAPGGRLEGQFHHIRLGCVDHQWHFDARGQFLDHLAHHFGFVGALGDRHGNIQGMRPAFHLFAAQLQNRVIVFSQQEALEFAAALGIAAFADQQRRRLLLHGYGACGRGHARCACLGARRMRLAPRRRAAQLLNQTFQVRRGGSTAAAHHADMVLLDKLVQRSGKRLRFERVDRLAIHIQRQPGVGNARNRQRGIFAQEADRLAHMLRPGRTVQANHIDAQALQNRQGSGDIRAQQHAPAGIQCYLSLHRQVDARLGKSLVQPSDGGLNFQDILRGFHQQHIRPALDQPDSLLAEDIRQFVKADIREFRVIGGGQLARRADRASYKARLCRRGIFVCQAARQGGCRAVDFDHALLQTIFRQGNAVGAKGVRFQYIYTDF